MVASVYFDYGLVECYLTCRPLIGRPGIAWKPLRWPSAPLDGTLAARGHVLAARDGREAEWMRAVLEAQYAHGRCIHRLEVLERVAAAVGIADFAARVQAEDVAHQVEANGLEAQLLRVARLPAAMEGGALRAEAADVARLTWA